MKNAKFFYIILSTGGFGRLLRPVVFNTLINKMKKVYALAAGMLFSSAVSAKVTLPKFITDNMVLQQNSTLTLPGHAAPGAKVSVKTDWLGNELTTKAGADGSFKISVPTPAAGGPFTMIISDSDNESPLVLSNLLSGGMALLGAVQHGVHCRQHELGGVSDGPR